MTSFNPIESINSLIEPLGLAISNKQQIINKIALAFFAMLAINHAFSTVEGNESFLLNRCINKCRWDHDCVRNCYDRIMF
jgi:hypothetical protein